MIIEIIRLAVGVLLDLALLGLSVMALGLVGLAAYVLIGALVDVAKKKRRG